MAAPATPKLTIPSVNMIYSRADGQRSTRPPIPTSRSSGATRHRLRRGAAAARRAGLPVPAVRRHESRDDQRPHDAARRSRRVAMTPSTCTWCSSAAERRDRAEAGGHGDHHPHVSWQLPARRTRRRAATTSSPGAVQRAGSRRLLRRVRRPSAPVASSRCGSCRGQDGRARLVTTKRGELEAKGTSSSDGSSRRAPSSRSSSSASRRSAASPRRSRATTQLRAAGRQAAAGRRDGARGVG